jgi:hypothetical protein
MAVTSGRVTSGTLKHSSFYVTWQQVSQNVAENYTSINWQAGLNCGTSSWDAWYSNAVRINGVTINGSSVLSSTTYSNISGAGDHQLASGTVNIPHNSDGTKSFAIAISGWLYSYGDTNGSASFTLTTIPRKSSVSCNSFNIGDSTTITISRASENFTHTLEWYFGEASGTLKTKITETSVGVTIPAASLYTQIPNATSGTGTIKCYTYSGNTHIGTSECTFTAYAKESACIPTVSATIIDTNTTTTALTGSNTKFVKGFSNAQVTVSATPKNSATISKYATTADGTTKATATSTFNNISNKDVTVKVTDSRGYSKQNNYSLTWVNYVKLAFTTISIKRTESTASTATMTLKGNYFNDTFGSVNNSLTVRYRYKQVGGSYGSWTTITPTISSNTFSKTVNLSNLSPDNEYLFQFEISDQLMTVTQTFQLSKGIPAIRIGKDYLEISNLRDTGIIDKYNHFLKPLRNSYFLGVNSATWIYLGEFDLANQGKYAVIDCYFGNGQNGNAYQNTHARILLKQGWSQAESPIGVTTKFIQNYNKSVKVKIAYNGVTKCKLYIYLPWSYSDFTYTLNGSYLAYTPFNIVLDSEPDTDKESTYYSDEAISLYDNSSGTTGTVTLSDSVANYSRIIVFYGCDGFGFSETLDSPNNKNMGLKAVFCGTGNDYMYIYTTRCVITNNTITQNYSRNNFIANDNSIATYGNNKYIVITKVIGYK